MSSTVHDAEGPTRAEAEFDARAFRSCLGQYATGVTIITTEHAGQRTGIAANSFSSLSLDPPLVLWSIGRTSRSFSAFQEATHFAVNVLESGQVDVSKTFSSSTTDKFSSGSWSAGQTGSPVLDGAVAVIECSVATRHDAGDHVLIIGQVERFSHRTEGTPLLFSQGSYGIPGEHPALAARAPDPSDGPVS